MNQSFVVVSGSAGFGTAETGLSSVSRVSPSLVVCVNPFFPSFFLFPILFLYISFTVLDPTGLLAPRLHSVEKIEKKKLFKLNKK